MSEEECIFCERRIGESLKSKEHIIPECIGGRLTFKNVCRECNSKFGSEFERELEISFGIIKDFLGLKSNGKPSKKARFDHEGRKVIMDKEGPRLKDIRVVSRENGETILAFPNEESMRKYYTRMQEKYPDTEIDIERKIRESEKHFTEFKVLRYKSIFPFDKIVRASAKMIYEFLHSIKPNIALSSTEFRDFIIKPNRSIPVTLLKNYYPFNLNYDHIYHSMVIDARSDEKVIFGYVELYSSFKIVFLLDDNYGGLPFSVGYYLDLMESKGYSQSIDKLPLNKEFFMELTKKFDFSDYHREVGNSIALFASKARLYPIKEVLTNIKSRLQLKDFKDIKEKYEFISCNLIEGLKRLGFEESVPKGTQDELLNKITYILQRLKQTFIEWDISIEIIDNIINLL